MTVATAPFPSIASRLVNTALSISPIYHLAKRQARQMMIQRSHAIGVNWMEEVATLKARNWQSDLEAVQNPALVYPKYYVTSFHAYTEGNLGWEPALEVEVAAHAVHARIWQAGSADGDARLRQSYHEVLKATIPSPQDILDLGCSVGMSTFALQTTYPLANITGLDLSPYFLAVANYRTQQRSQGNQYGVQANFLAAPATPLSPPRWLHAPAEATNLPTASVDLVSAFLMFHELPQQAAIAIFQEARRVLRPGGHLAIMEMNPQSEIYAKMPPYILTLLKSTEPYLDEYFALDIEAQIGQAGFEQPTITCNSPRHRTMIAKAR
jgi:ubiquinone/menaquinone biosynthesis C-methylase UbiE